MHTVRHFNRGNTQRGIQLRDSPSCLRRDKAKQCLATCTESTCTVVSSWLFRLKRTNTWREIQKSKKKLNILPVSLYCNLLVYVTAPTKEQYSEKYSSKLYPTMDKTSDTIIEQNDRPQNRFNLHTY